MPIQAGPSSRNTIPGGRQMGCHQWDGPGLVDRGHFCALWRVSLQPSDLLLIIPETNCSAVDSGQDNWRSGRQGLWFPSHGAAPPACSH